LIDVLFVELIRRRKQEVIFQDLTPDRDPGSQIDQEMRRRCDSGLVW
jgi:hypothetical protein